MPNVSLILTFVVSMDIQLSKCALLFSPAACELCSLVYVTLHYITNF